MKNTMMILTLSMLGFSASAMAQSAGELTCKAKAKEAAVTLYSNCMTEYQNTKMEEIRSNYKADLQSLKEKYGSQLKELSGGQAVETAPATIESNARKQVPRTIRTTKAPQRSASLAEKQAPIATKVVPVETENPPIELIDNPVETTN